MYMLVIIALVAALVFVSAFAIHFFFLTKKIASEEHAVEPFSPYLIGVSAATFAVVILLLFYFFVDDNFSIKSNLGQVCLLYTSPSPRDS